MLRLSQLTPGLDLHDKPERQPAASARLLNFI